MHAAGFHQQEHRYFLYFPESIYRYVGDAVEKRLSRLALGGQYAVFGTKGAEEPR
jgi:hypothetical protein